MVNASKNFDHLNILYYIEMHFSKKLSSMTSLFWCPWFNVMNYIFITVPEFTSLLVIWKPYYSAPNISRAISRFMKRVQFVKSAEEIAAYTFVVILISPNCCYNPTQNKWNCWNDSYCVYTTWKLDMDYRIGWDSVYVY